MIKQKMARPGVGVGVYIVKGEKVLLGKRKSNHGNATWCPPGGHMEFGETPIKTAKREVYEECGLKIKKIKLGPYTNDVHLNEGRHFITLSAITQWAGGEPKLKEPDKCCEWGWYRWDDLPGPLFLPVQSLYNSGFNPIKYARKKTIN